MQARERKIHLEDDQRNGAAEGNVQRIAQQRSVRCDCTGSDYVAKSLSRYLVPEVQNYEFKTKALEQKLIKQLKEGITELTAVHTDKNFRLKEDEKEGPIEPQQQQNFILVAPEDSKAETEMGDLFDY